MDRGGEVTMGSQLIYKTPATLHGTTEQTSQRGCRRIGYLHVYCMLSICTLVESELKVLSKIEIGRERERDRKR